MLEIKQYRQAVLDQRAVELAETGRYSYAEEIERALMAEGFLEARESLDSENIRKDLRNVCLAAQERTADINRTERL